jgi:cell division septum initiation protein DivIVA
MKKVLFLALAAASFSFTACESKKEEAVEQQAETVRDNAEAKADSTIENAEAKAESMEEGADKMAPATETPAEEVKK